MLATLLLSLLFLVTCCHSNESKNMHDILEKNAISLDKRSDGLMAELVHLLVEQRHERRSMLRRCKMAEDMVYKLTKDLNVTKQSVKQLGKKTIQQHIKTQRRIDYTSNSIKDLYSRSNQRSSQIGIMQKQISKIQKTKDEFGKKNRIGFSARFKPFNSKSFSKGVVVKFDHVISNQGNGYNTTTGKFTCMTPGLYLFHLTVVSDTDWGYAFIVKNMIEINQALSTLEGERKKRRYESGSTSVILTLRFGDEVWIKSGGHTETTNFEWHSIFSGVLIS